MNHFKLVCQVRKSIFEDLFAPTQQSIVECYSSFFEKTDIHNKVVIGGRMKKTVHLTAKAGIIKEIYRQLLDRYGPQGWWPLSTFDETNTLKKNSISGYHPLDYSFPQNSQQQFEIICGAVLTQNTTWVSAKKAIQNLNSINLLSAKNFILATDNTISKAIKPAGYKNQKREYLKNCAMFFLKLNGKTPTREKLMAVKGVGPETADSILLYAYKIPTFVVDAYTTRFLLHHKIIPEKSSYNQINALFENELKKDFKVYQEFHALLVEHGKRFFSKKPYKGDNILIGSVQK